jgi:hypothetical protein
MNLIEQVRKNPSKKRGVGLRDSTPEEIEDLLKELRTFPCKVIHQTHYTTGGKLPFNGLLRINY